jgi:hypothetical protein
MTIISSLRTFIATCPLLEAGALILVDQLGQEPIQYALIPLPGERIVEKYLNGSSLREFPFLFQTSESTADDLERIENAGFQEQFADWLEAQTETETLPDLGSNKTAERIEAVQWGYLYESGISDTGIYQISCKLVYRQTP